MDEQEVRTETVRADEVRVGDLLNFTGQKDPAGWTRVLRADPVSRGRGVRFMLLSRTGDHVTISFHSDRKITRQVVG